ncbi:HAD family hydrolase [Colibacter massiliensis]|uniref:HAD family hydrolase n=1 Tax=Colibacter massiliensis TaxID=1852379 RepID=UPI003F93ADC0
MNELLQQEIDRHHIVTFDVYDTLIRRAVYQDKDIFELVAREFQKRYGRNIPDFSVKRMQADVLARTRYPYREINLDEIYKELVTTIGEAAARECKAIELELEINLTFPNADIVEAFTYALRQQKSVYIISDMYLRQSHIAAALTHCGVRGYKKIFVSCEYRATKHEQGELYRLFLEEIGGVPGNVLHIGNDKKADIRKAQAVGMDTYLVTPSHYRKYVNECKAKKNLDYSLLYGLITKRLVAANESPAYCLGFNVFGPILTGFLAWLKEKCRKLQLDRILFLARDGYVLQKLCEGNSELGQTDYFYMSRRSVVIPMIQYQTGLSEILQLYKSWPKKMPIYILFDKLGISQQTDTVQAVGIKNNELFSKDDFITDPRVQKLFEHIRDDVIENSIEQGQLLKDYILSYNINGRTGVVDLGAGTIFEALVQFSRLNGLDIQWKPLYLQSDLHTKQSFIDVSCNYELQTVMRLGYMFLEVFFTAPHGTVRAYVKKNNKVVPVLVDYEYAEQPEQYRQRLAQLHSGAIDFCRLAEDGLNHYGKFDAEAVLANLIFFILHPTDEDVTYWGDYPFFVEEFVSMLPTTDRLEYIKHPAQLLRDMRDCVWLAGFMHRLLSSNILLRLMAEANIARLKIKQK